MKTVLSVVLAAVGILCSERAIAAEDPFYQGNPLSAWLGKLRNARSPEAQNQAAEAVRQIGTNALPFLLEELKVLDVAWKANITNFYKKSEMVDRMMNLRVSFKVLGPIAKPYFGDLASCVGAGGLLSDVSAYALTQIDPPMAAVVLTQTFVTNQNDFIRCMAINNLCFVGTNADIAVPVLIQSLSEKGDTDAALDTKRLAVIAIGRAHKMPEQAVPTLTQIVKEHSSWALRAEAARALGAFSKEAQSALSVLRQTSINDPDVHVRAVVAASIIKIERAADLEQKN